MMCLACGCNNRHIKADGSCLCGCKQLVTAWEAERPASIAEVKLVPFEQLKDPE